MTPASNKFGVVFLTLAVIVLMSLTDASQTKTRVTRLPGKRFRIPRQSGCQDGEYQQAGITCCRCPAGHKVVRHCKSNPNDGECGPCDTNLEVVVPCTSIQNTKCQCKEDHYCSSGTDTCILCQPCQQCGVEGIKAKDPSPQVETTNQRIKQSCRFSVISNLACLILQMYWVGGICRK
ncbi:hypothetical protein INR49_018969 [Caranx melampygus]|nr:hypothetical protein INR49_018969 [Caranx melampygus]